MGLTSLETHHTLSHSVLSVDLQDQSDPHSAVEEPEAQRLRPDKVMEPGSGVAGHRLPFALFSALCPLLHGVPADVNEAKSNAGLSLCMA